MLVKAGLRDAPSRPLTTARAHLACWYAILTLAVDPGWPYDIADE